MCADELVWLPQETTDFIHLTRPDVNCTSCSTLPPSSFTGLEKWSPQIRHAINIHTSFCAKLIPGQILNVGQIEYIVSDILRKIEIPTACRSRKHSLPDRVPQVSESVQAWTWAGRHNLLDPALQPRHWQRGRNPPVHKTLHFHWSNILKVIRSFDQPLKLTSSVVRCATPTEDGSWEPGWLITQNTDQAVGPLSNVKPLYIVPA